MKGRAVSVLCGVTLLVAAALATQRWFELHVFWQYITATPGERSFMRFTRGVLVLLGMLFLVFNRPIGAWFVGRPVTARLGRVAQFVLAIVAALVVGELLARRKPEQPAPVARWPDLNSDDRLGWYPKPDSSVDIRIAGRQTVDYYDAQSARVRSAEERTNPALPSVLFIGESYLYGPGLSYDETVSTQAGTRLGLQPVNLAVPGYSTSQEYFRLERALGAYQRPVAVVFVFLPAQLARDMDDRHPHFERTDDGGLSFVPSEPAWRRFRIRYALREALHLHTAEAIPLTARIMREEAAMVRAHGAKPLWLIPAFGPPRPFDTLPVAPLVQELFVDQGLDFVMGFFPYETLLKGDPHPGPVAAQLMAEAVVDGLKKAGVEPKPSE